jgi:DNA-binding MarR family transcriptional regulator
MQRIKFIEEMSTKSAIKSNQAELAREFGRLVSEMKNEMRQYLQEKIREAGLDISFELLEIMALLWQKDGVSHQEIADLITKDKSSLTYLIDNLVKKNLVKRVEDKNDRRIRQIFLTAKGKLLQKKLNPWVLELYQKATEGITAAEISNAIRVVNRMKENLQRQEP